MGSEATSLCYHVVIHYLGSNRSDCSIDFLQFPYVQPFFRNAGYCGGLFLVMN